MVCGILAHKKAKKERLEPLFFYARHFPCSTIGRRGWSSERHILRAAFLLAAPASGLERAEMNRWPWRTSGYGTFRTCRDVRVESAFRGKPDLTIATADFRV